MGLLLTRFSSVTLAGPTIAAVFTMFGFGLFGKSVLNIVWIILGVFIASRLAGKSFGSYSLIALFGTALGPLVTYVMFDLGLPYAISLPLGALSGIAAGFLLPALAGQMLSLHQGYSLYNMGFTCGFLGLFAASILKASKAMAPIEVFWNTAHSTALTLIIPIFSLLSILYGFLFSPYSFRRIIGEVIGIQNQTGRLPSDFFDIVENSESPWVNMGLLGFAGFAIVVATGSTINGPIIAGLATLMGFGLFGKSLKELRSHHSRSDSCRTALRQTTDKPGGYPGDPVLHDTRPHRRSVRYHHRYHFRLHPPDDGRGHRNLARWFRPLQQRFRGRPHRHPRYHHHPLVPDHKHQRGLHR